LAALGEGIAGAAGDFSHPFHVFFFAKEPLITAKRYFLSACSGRCAKDDIHVGPCFIIIHSLERLLEVCKSLSVKKYL
jgi:hypothetical protein